MSEPEIQTKSMPSLETGEGCFELHYDYSNASNFSIPLLVNAYFRVYTQTHPSIIPVITSVKQLSDDKVEIKRQIIYKNYYNTSQLPEETFVVDRSKMRKKNEIVMQMLATYPGLKTEALKVFGIGYSIQRCLPEFDNCKAFQDSGRIQMLSDVYMYKQLQQCQKILAVIEDRSEGYKSSKEKLNDLRMSDLFELV